jgi:hypothetical protein
MISLFGAYENHVCIIVLKAFGSLKAVKVGVGLGLWVSYSKSWLSLKKRSGS